MVGEPSKPSGLTWRALLIATPLIIIDNFWITVVEVRWYTLDGTCLPLFITPIFLLFLLTLGNFAARRLTRRCLSQAELLTVYISVVIAAALAGHDMIQNLFGSIAHAHWFETPENGWKQLFFRYLPKWLLVTNREALKGLYYGNTNPYNWKLLAHWVGPLAGWAALLFILMGMMLAMNVIIRRQWTENEKLVFPLVQLPLAMTAPDSGTKFYKNRLMWLGFAIAGFITTLNGFHHLYPSMPYLNYIKLYDLRQHVSSRPWDAIGWTPISMYPFAIGLAYFIPLDLSFSCWFFYLFRKAFQVFGAVMGWDSAQNVGFPFFNEQASGAWIALGLAIVWGSRGYLRKVWRSAFGKEPLPDAAAAEEATRCRWAFIAIIGGTAALLVFTRFMGMKAWVALAFFAIYFLLSITMTRVRAELGTPHEIFFVHPQQIIVTLLGPNLIGKASMTGMATMYWFNRCYRAHPMPNQLEAFKMAEGKPMSTRGVIWTIVFASVLGVAVTYWTNLHVTYHAGAQAKCLGFKDWVGAQSYDPLAGWLRGWQRLSPTRIGYMVGGFAMVFALRAVRGAFIWWPFHPAGYALAVSYAMDYFWFAFFVSWFLKSVLVRYGGMKWHNGAVPFFLGAILGDYTFGSIWAIIGPVMGLQTYKIFI